MDSDPPRSSSPRKVRFSPKPPQARKKASKRRVEAGNTDEEEDNEDKIELQQILNETQRRGRGRPKADKKSSVQVAFGGVTAGGNSGIKSGEKASKDSGVLVDTCEDVLSLSTDTDTETSSSKTKKKEYQEPWDYENSYYPITLPLRAPGSGDPVVLDEKEFGKNGEVPEYDESTINSALSLGLMEEDVNAKMMFFKLPVGLPCAASGLFPLPGHVTKPVQDTNSSSKGIAAKGKQKASVDIDPLSPGHMGKMLVYKSGKVKMKLGDVLYDVSPGVEAAFSQNVAVMNTEDRECCVLGEMSKVAVVAPEFDSVCTELGRLKHS